MPGYSKTALSLSMKIYTVSCHLLEPRVYSFLLDMETTPFDKRWISSKYLHIARITSLIIHIFTKIPVRSTKHHYNPQSFTVHTDKPTGPLHRSPQTSPHVATCCCCCRGDRRQKV